MYLISCGVRVFSSSRGSGLATMKAYWIADFYWRSRESDINFASRFFWSFSIRYLKRSEVSSCLDKKRPQPSRILMIMSISLFLNSSIHCLKMFYVKLGLITRNFVNSVRNLIFLILASKITSSVLFGKSLCLSKSFLIFSIIISGISGQKFPIFAKILQKNGAT